MLRIDPAMTQDMLWLIKNLKISFPDLSLQTSIRVSKKLLNGILQITHLLMSLKRI